MPVKEEELAPISLNFAPAWKRIAAYIIDSVILGTVVIMMVVAISNKELGFMTSELQKAGIEFSTNTTIPTNYIQQTNAPQISVTQYNLNSYFKTYIKLVEDYYATYGLIILIINIVIRSIYFVLFWVGTGQTFGNKIMKIAVIDIRNRRIPVLPAIIRYGLIYLSAQIFYLPLLFLVNKVYQQRIPDFFSKSVVVEVPEFNVKDEE